MGFDSIKNKTIHNNKNVAEIELLPMFRRAHIVRAHIASKDDRLNAGSNPCSLRNRLVAQSILLLGYKIEICQKVT